MRLPHWIGWHLWILHKSIKDKQWNAVYAKPWIEERKVRDLYECSVCQKRWEHIWYDKRDKPSIFDSKWERYGWDD